MPLLNGHPNSTPIMVPTGIRAPTGGSVGGPVNAPRQVQTSAIVVDGTPIRVIVYTFAAAAAIVALRMAGFKFNVGVAS